MTDLNDSIFFMPSQIKKKWCCVLFMTLSFWVKFQATERCASMFGSVDNDSIFLIITPPPKIFVASGIKHTASFTEYGPILHVNQQHEQNYNHSQNSS